MALSVTHTQKLTRLSFCTICIAQGSEEKHHGGALVLHKEVRVVQLWPLPMSDSSALGGEMLVKAPQLAEDDSTRSLAILK